MLVPDNLRTGVTKHTSKGKVLNSTYRELPEHYGMVVLPTRVKKPKNKPSVEGVVGFYQDGRTAFHQKLLGLTWAIFHDMPDKPQTIPRLFTGNSFGVVRKYRSQDFQSR
ncbi:MAG: hypothetical protein LKF36_00380 [Lactobacillus sp.]|nr:hypothetical protein [Lactobacillus sp.]